MKDEIFTIDGEKYKVIKMLYNDKTDKSYPALWTVKPDFLSGDW